MRPPQKTRPPSSLTDPAEIHGSPEALARLHAACFSTPRPWKATEFAELLRSRGTFLTLHEFGFALGRTIADEAELLTLAVDPSTRRVGIGRTLLAAYEAKARETGAAESFLEVAQDNLAAIHLYSSAGYTESGKRRGYYRDNDGNSVDALIMRKALLQA